MSMWTEPAARVITSMQPACFTYNTARGKRTRPSPDGRTINEECFDSGVFAASEFIRRLTRDENLALAVHEVCIWRQREHEAAEATGLPVRSSGEPSE